MKAVRHSGAAATADGTRHPRRPRPSQPLYDLLVRHELFYLEPDGTLIAVPVSASMELGRSAALFKLRAHPRADAWLYAVLPDGSSVVAAIPTQSQTGDVISILTDWTEAFGK